MIVLSPQRADPGAWDTLVLDDMTFPGQAKVEFDRGRTIERKKIPGKNGEDLDFKGVGSGDLDITIKVWAATDYDVAEAHIKAIDPVPGKKEPKIHAIGHKVPNSRGCSYCVIEKIKGPKDEGDGYTTWKIQAFERVKPNTNNVGLGGPTGETCDQLRHEYSRRRDLYLQTKARAQGLVAELREAQHAGLDAPYADDARALQYEQKIREIENEVQRQSAQLEMVRQAMVNKKCPNTPPNLF